MGRGRYYAPMKLLVSEDNIEFAELAQNLLNWALVDCSRVLWADETQTTNATLKKI